MMISVASHGSDKPVCHGGAKVLYGCPRSITVISMFYYGLLHYVAVSCVPRCNTFFRSVKVSYGRNLDNMQFKAFYVPFI